MSDVNLKRVQTGDEKAFTEPQHISTKKPQISSPEKPQSDKNEVRAYTNESSNSD